MTPFLLCRPRSSIVFSVQCATHPVIAIMVALGLSGSTRPAFAAEEAGSPARSGSVEPRTGFQMALRTGWTLPMGSADGAHDMTQLVAAQLPVVLEVGARFVPSLLLGGYMGAGFGNANTNGSALGLRIGGEALWYLAPDKTYDPWVGYGFGYESISKGGDSSYSGLEFAHIMGGVDFRVSKAFDLGPYFDVSIGKYLHHDENYVADGTPIDGAIQQTATHEWVAFGLRGTVLP
jgi:hypothetical protein